MDTKCLICNKPLTTKQIRQKGKFCSSECYRAYSKTHPNSGTFKKGNPAPKTAFKKNQKAWNKGLENYWCTGNKNVNWKGGKIMDCGYIALLSPNHPAANSKGYVREHRLVVEEILGRYLFKGEIIHHINNIITDNRPQNLYLFSSNSEHSRYHNAVRFKGAKPIKKSNIIFQ